MDPNTLLHLVDWFKQHPNLLIGSEGLTPSQKLFQFLSRPYDLCDYDDPVLQTMSQRPSEDRPCQYVFRRGLKNGQMCQVFSREQRCPFHDHMIFSPQFNDLLFNLIGVMDGEYTRAPFYFKEPLTRGEKILFWGGFYIDPKKRLVYKVAPDSSLICIGYSPEGSSEIQPLTSAHLKQ